MIYITNEEADAILLSISDPAWNRDQIERHHALCNAAVEQYIIKLQKLQMETAPQPEQSWQPIKTAPKDGSAILLYFPHKDIVIRGCWEWQGEGDWETCTPDWQDWCTDDDVVIQEDPSYEPSLWMPLPKPPAKDIVVHQNLVSKLKNIIEKE